MSYLSPEYARVDRRQRIQETVDRIGQIPGVEAVAAVNLLPLRGEDWVSGLEEPEQSPRPVDEQALAAFDL